MTYYKNVFAHNIYMMQFIAKDSETAASYTIDYLLEWGARHLENQRDALNNQARTIHQLQKDVRALQNQTEDQESVIDDLRNVIDDMIDGEPE